MEQELLTQIAEDVHSISIDMLLLCLLVGFFLGGFIAKVMTGR